MHLHGVATARPPAPGVSRRGRKEGRITRRHHPDWRASIAPTVGHSGGGSGRAAVSRAEATKLALFGKQRREYIPRDMPASIGAIARLVLASTFLLVTCCHGNRSRPAAD